MSSNYERELSKPPPSIEEEHMSLLKEIRDQLNVMQSEMRSLRSELHQTQPVSHLEEDPALNSIQAVITAPSTLLLLGERCLNNIQNVLNILFCFLCEAHSLSDGSV